MTPLPRATDKDVVRAIEGSGFVLSHLRGRHHYLKKPGGGRLISVPVHGNRDLPTGTLRSIIRQAEITTDTLTQALYS
ncbi:MAG: type II toxin-antitoxin system HicA family toxin [Chloroflexia bacterium]|nr:type II toxin-antitoxin system HicA family toxin [Chloroflexia bacterium]